MLRIIKRNYEGFMEESGIIVFCTFPDIEEAKSIAEELVNNKLAACCNILPQITSIYTWESKLQEDQEILMIIKTTNKCYDKLEKQIKMLHSYSVPEIISTQISKGSKAYLDWVQESTQN